MVVAVAQAQELPYLAQGLGRALHGNQQLPAGLEHPRGLAQESAVKGGRVLFHLIKHSVERLIAPGNILLAGAEDLRVRQLQPQRARMLGIIRDAAGAQTIFLRKEAQQPGILAAQIQNIVIIIHDCPLCQRLLRSAQVRPILQTQRVQPGAFLNPFEHCVLPPNKNNHFAVRQNDYNTSSQQLHYVL